MTPTKGLPKRAKSPELGHSRVVLSPYLKSAMARLHAQPIWSLIPSTYLPSSLFTDRDSLLVRKGITTSTFPRVVASCI